MNGNFAPIFEDIAQKGAQAVLINTDTAFALRNREVAALAMRHRIPAVSSFRGFADAGGLMT
jgi:putative tryptophan/tyrosine transport system substrate-binding protein